MNSLSLLHTGDKRKKNAVSILFLVLFNLSIY